DGYVEVLPFPFVAPGVWDAFGLPGDDPRRRAVRVRNPLEADADRMATTLLPGLLDILQHNVSRGATDLALYHVGQVAFATEQAGPAPVVGVSRRPPEDELAALSAAIPDQRVHVAAVLAGQRQRHGWWGKGEPASWSDAIQAARVVAEESGTELTVRAAEYA